MARRMMCVILAAFMILSFAAQAETEGYWTNNADWYYHLSPYCGGIDSMVPISLDGADAFGKYPCPACVPGEGGIEIEGAIEGGMGLVVIRIPENWQEVKLRNSSGDDSDACYEGEQMYRALGDYLNGAEYTRFLRDYRDSGSASATVVVPPDLIGIGAEPLSKRHIGGAWLYVFPPAPNVKGGTADISVIGIEFDLHAEDGLLVCDGKNYAYEEFGKRQNLALRQEHGGVIFKREYGELRVYVKRMLDEYVALIQRDGGEAIRDAELCIGESHIALCGGVDAAANIYACVLTEAEWNALQADVPVELRAKPTFPEFYGTPYAVLVDEERGCAIIDREGGIAVDFGTYLSISREASDRIFACEQQDSEKIYLNGWTLEVVER